jgi:ABC-type branched-subunit amino acid transport system ATPase component
LVREKGYFLEPTCSGSGEFPNILFEAFPLLSAHWERELSYDEQECLAFARILLHKPRWLVIEEALEALEDEARKRLRGARTMNHLAANVKALEIELAPERIAALDGWIAGFGSWIRSWLSEPLKDSS